jgi:acetolactate synthase-1/2/3 large subunit
MIKVSDVISEFLVKNNIEVVFGIIGSANSHIFNSIDQNSNIKLVSVHHEQAAVMAMGAYYRATGKLAAALVTAGGGSSNAFTGILSNWADSIPGIIISGQEQSYYIEEYSDMRMYGIQGYDSVETYRKHAKLCERVTKENLYDMFHEAFRITQEGRPGPVFLEIPFDVQGQSVEEKEITPYTPSEINYNPSNADKIVELLNKAERPLILGGHGVKLSKSEEIFSEFINKHNIPTVLSWSAVDLLPTDNNNNYGRPGVQGQRSANNIIQNCDLLIVMGSRLSLLQTGYSRVDFAPKATIVHIDIDPTETRKFNSININEDIKPILSDLLTKDIKLNITQWREYCDFMRVKYPLVMPEHLADPTNSYKFMDWFSRMVPDNYTIVTDMGTALLSGFYGFNIKPNQKMFTSLGLGEMGYGTAAAVGAGFGDKPVMCLNCDGGMMMNLQELQTIVTHNLPVKIVIFNNDGYLMIKHTQKLLFGENRTCVDQSTGVTLPDYKKVAKAFGFAYYTENEVENFLSDPGQAIMEVFMDPQQEFIPKVRGMKMPDGTIKAGLLEEMSPFLPLADIEQNMISGINERSKTLLR